MKGDPFSQNPFQCPRIGPFFFTPFEHLCSACNVLQVHRDRWPAQALQKVSSLFSAWLYFNCSECTRCGRRGVRAPLLACPFSFPAAPRSWWVKFPRWFLGRNWIRTEKYLRIFCVALRNWNRNPQVFLRLGLGSWMGMKNNEKTCKGSFFLSSSSPSRRFWQLPKT